MACTSVTLNGVTLDCGNVGGLKSVWIVDKLDVSGLTYTSGEISAITMVTSKKFKKFEFRKGNANFVSTSTRNDANGTVFVDTTLTMNFNFMETVKRNDMVALTKANTYVIVKDNNNKFWFIGYDTNTDGYVGGSVNANSGAAMGDANNYVVTLTAQTAELPLEVVSGVMTTTIVDKL